ncbi:MAG: CBS domain-containing protein, partial [Acinetobacter sp.]|nr:CBS domain-containing protein [Acinetobacter sp.]
MTTVAQVIQDKIGREIYTILPSATVLEAITLMANKGIGAVVVTQDTKVV